MTPAWAEGLRGRLAQGRAMADLTWLRVGGPAEWFYQPADIEDLQAFMAALPPDVPLFVMGVGSNLIVRDGGLPGVVLRLGRPFMEIEVEGTRVTAGAAALDAQVAKRAAAEGVDLTFLRTIPGAIGGAVAMNAGCYGSYVADRLAGVRAVLRDGSLAWIDAGALELGYRRSSLPEGAVVVEAVFEGSRGDPDALAARMEEQLAKRDATQPTKDRSAGSTFRNPAGFSSTGLADDSQELKAWKVIEDAGLRGAAFGHAQMSPKHPNFLVNTGQATAYELESLGETVRKRVYEHSGLRLEWEIRRVGLPGPDGPVADAFEDDEKS